MRWTNEWIHEKPIQPGYYWWKDVMAGVKAQPVRVCYSPGDGRRLFMWSMDGSKIPLQEVTGEWGRGPLIAPPHDQEAG